MLRSLFELFPKADVYTSIWQPENMPAAINAMPIRTSFMQRLPGIFNHHRWYFPLYPLAFQAFDLSGYDLVITNTQGFANGVRTGASRWGQEPGARGRGPTPDSRLPAPVAGRRPVTICYCLTPMRWAWNTDEYVGREGLGRAGRLALQPLMQALRAWDRWAAGHMQHFIGISRAVAERIGRVYGREAAVIYPPVEARKHRISRTVEDYFLVVSRLAPYKRIDLAVEACTRLNLGLKVIGDGRDLERLRKMAGPTVEFLGFEPDDAMVRRHYARCKAFLFPGEEDFGISPLEAQASGRPAIAYAAGGALDTIKPGVTGELFQQPTVDSLVAVLRDFDASRYDPQRIREHALQFDSSVFKQRIKEFVERVTDGG
ncbi:MAG TPA: glycosyltransferase [Chloroflexota bacterium]|nr:glycosyltransferase [Chloroflexota bacterium]